MKEFEKIFNTKTIIDLIYEQINIAGTSLPGGLYCDFMESHGLPKEGLMNESSFKIDRKSIATALELTGICIR